jgi:3-oxoacyl-[acyl-carrier protein] reductase
MDLGIQGRVALVAGATRGIGLAIARTLSNEGARVAVVARTKRDVDRVARSLGSVGVTADLTTERGCNEAVDTITSALGAIEILVNVLGTRGPRTWADTSSTAIESTIDGNVTPVVRLLERVLPGMLERHWGRAVIISSIFGLETGGAPAYSIAKAAEIGLVRSYGVRLLGTGVTINAVAPGAILFEGGSWDRRLREDPAAMTEFIDRELPSKRFGTPEEVAAVVAFLSCVPASGCNGSCWVVDGAQSRSMSLL